MSRRLAVVRLYTRMRPINRAHLMSLAPGLATAGLVAIAARGVGAVAPPVVGEVFPAILFGLALAPFIRGDTVALGLRFAVSRLLRIGIVLFGARLSINAIADVGVSVVLVVAIIVIAAFALAVGVGHLLNLRTPTTILIAVGTAICGNSAIIATAPVIGAEERDVSVAVATISTFGMIAVFVYPVLGAILGMSDASFGRWSGVAVHDTSQVVAASFAYSDRAGDIAIVVKLVRNAALAPVLLLIGMWWVMREAQPSGVGPVARPRLRDSFPLFILGFLALAAINSIGWLEPVVAGRSLAAWSAELASAVILVALAAVGLGTDIRTLWANGLSPFLAGLSVASGVALVGLALVLPPGISL